jgi:acyl-CoA dehydrogenase
MYTMGTVLRHGSEAAEEALPAEDRRAASCACRPSASPSRRAAPTPPSFDPAVRKGGGYVVNGQKVWTSRAEHSDLMLLLARTTPVDQVKKRTDGLSVFLVDLREAKGNGMTIRRSRDDQPQHDRGVLRQPADPGDELVGEEGKGFRYILDGMNAERILIASEASATAAGSSKARATTPRAQVFGRPIGQNQGIQFPIAEATRNSRPPT